MGAVCASSLCARVAMLFAALCHFFSPPAECACAGPRLLVAGKAAFKIAQGLMAWVGLRKFARKAGIFMKARAAPLSKTF